MLDSTSYDKHTLFSVHNSFCDASGEEAEFKPPWKIFGQFEIFVSISYIQYLNTFFFELKVCGYLAFKAEAKIHRIIVVNLHILASALIVSFNFSLSFTFWQMASSLDLDDDKMFLSLLYLDHLCLLHQDT